MSITRRDSLAGTIGLAATAVAGRILRRTPEPPNECRVEWSVRRNPVADILAMQRRTRESTGLAPDLPLYVPPGFDAMARMAYPGREVVEWELPPGLGPTPVEVRARRMRLARQYRREMGEVFA